METTPHHSDQYMLNSPEGPRSFRLANRAMAHIPDMELREEWQDDDFPRPLPEDSESLPEEDESSIGGQTRPAPPNSLALSGALGGGAKKRLAAPALSLTLSGGGGGSSLDPSGGSGDGRFSAAALSATPPNDTPDDTPSLDINLEALDTPSDSESCSFPDRMHDLEWEDDLPRLGQEGPGGAAGGSEHTEVGSLELDQVDSKGRRWRRFSMGGQESQVNMSVLEPYLQVLSHGGYYGDGSNAIILFTSCYLPDNTVEHYEYVMDNLFRYLVGTLDLMVSQNYVLVYLCSMAPRSRVPSMRWLRLCYTSIERRLKKDLKGMFVVHPAWYIKALITVIKPFISEKFSRKIRFIPSLAELSEYIPTERLQIPDCIREFDQQMNR